MTTRSPIVSVLGHVDHGKSSILDSIRGTNIVAGEAGAITQAIGASIIPMDVIKKKCGKLLESLKINFNIPGLLFVDTPGHAAFTTLRKRGGSLADIAVLVVDIKEGFKPQTVEAIEILKGYKTPFVIAANKLDLIPGYKKQNLPLLQEINSQSANVQAEIDKKIYELVGQLHDKFGIVSDRFDRVGDFTKQIIIIPCSAKENIGLQELLMMIAGLAQKFLETNLNIDVSGKAKGTILEVKEEKGLGKTIDVIIYDGTLHVNDTIVIGSMDKPISTKIRALFEPDPLAEMRDKKSKFKSVKQVSAAMGVKISAPDLGGVVAGMPLRACDPSEVETVKYNLMTEITAVTIETDIMGLIIKADTIGSLEAMINILKGKKIPIRKATIGNINKKDYAEAESNYENNPLLSVILGFNVVDESGSDNKNVKVLTNQVIYRLVDDFEKWQEEKRKDEEEKKLDKVIRPCKVEILQSCIFRQSNPCILGVEVLIGVLRVGTPLMKNGIYLSEVKSIQSEKENFQVVEKGKQVAVSLPHVTAGRQVFENDFLYSDISEEDFRKLKKLSTFLAKDEISLLKEIAEMHRKHNPVWGV
ncbi:MAG: translation initiation factor IF-2 [Nanoarchaeota archaeon]|nr:translation initiation factor IF-2 [Nanoarchaeota archaeon]MBU1270000.1 translation initiation factor IF-2 [Nanoarchaeota archaeon]MBU1603979.1 translation initiation factor IF-2 [Nanoarchaeota archaeon]MBU2443688.1 translation initiation factor IF-2 [Nanoarchaeota archaeon]